MVDELFALAQRRRLMLTEAFSLARAGDPRLDPAQQGACAHAPRVTRAETVGKARTLQALLRATTHEEEDVR